MYTARLKPISNRADYSQSIRALDASGTAIDLEAADASIICEIREANCSATTPMTVAISGTIFTISLTVAQTRSLNIQQHDVGCTIEIDGVVYPFFVGTVPVIDWVVA